MTDGEENLEAKKYGARHAKREQRNFDAEYTLGDELGTGAMSVVRVCEHRSTGKRLAAKCIAKEPLNLEDEEALMMEVNILQMLDHPNIVKLHGFFDEPTMFYLVMDLIEGGELFERIVQKEYYSEKEARDLIRILLDTIKYCHDHGIVHRDLKPENLLCVSPNDDSTVKLCDFGFAAKISETETLHQLCGTPGYVAPEILKRHPYREGVDMWSIGVLMFILLGGYPPFYDEDSKALYEKIKGGLYEFHEEYWGQISDEAKDLITKLLTVDPANRMVAQEALKHAWVASDDGWLATHSLARNLAELKRFQARKKFKAAAKAVIATHRLKYAFANIGKERKEEKVVVAKKQAFPDCYKMLGELGTGALSVVREAESLDTGMRFACKCVQKSSLHLEDHEALLAEAKLMQELDHPNIVRLHALFDEDNDYFLVMDLIEGGELFDRIVHKEYYNEKEARDLIKILMETISYCHEKRIVHRDIKPENLLCVSMDSDSQIKLCDFGFAAKIPTDTETPLTQLCGTPGYVAPEILKRQNYGFAVDMWSIGVLTYILLGGYPPFYDEDQNKLYAKIKDGEYEFHDEYWGQISDSAKDLITKLLTVDPDKRIKAPEGLLHAWVTESDNALANRDLSTSLREFKRYNGKRKFKATAKALIAARRLSLALRPDPVSRSKQKGAKASAPRPAEGTTPAPAAAAAAAIAE